MLQKLDDWQQDNHVRYHVSGSTITNEKGNWVTYFGKVASKNDNTLQVEDGTGKVSCSFEFEDIIEDVQDGDFVEIQGKVTMDGGLDSKQLTKVDGAQQGLRA